MNTERKFLLADGFDVQSLIDQSVLEVTIQQHYISSDLHRDVFVRVCGGDDITMCVVNKVNGLTQNTTSFEKSLFATELAALSELGWIKSSNRTRYIIPMCIDETIEVDLYNNQDAPTPVIVCFDARYLSLSDNQLPPYLGQEVTYNDEFSDFNFAC